jgi:hypothetical protein
MGLHGRIARGGHGRHKVSPGPATPFSGPPVGAGIPIDVFSSSSNSLIFKFNIQKCLFMKVDFIIKIKNEGLRKKQSFICWILVTNCWSKFDHIGFMLATFHTKSKGLRRGGSPAGCLLPLGTPHAVPLCSVAYTPTRARRNNISAVRCRRRNQLAIQTVSFKGKNY